MLTPEERREVRALQIRQSAAVAVALLLAAVGLYTLAPAFFAALGAGEQSALFGLAATIAGVLLLLYLLFPTPLRRGRRR